MLQNPKWSRYKFSCVYCTLGDYNGLENNQSKHMN